MSVLIRTFTLLLLFAFATAARAELIVLSYHNVEDIPGNELGTDSLSVSSTELAKQFSWLKEHGYQVVSIDDIEAAQQQQRSLPEKAVLLTFDDGYQGFYERAFPLLKLFNYPAVLAVMGKWLETSASQPVMYGTRPVKRDYFLNWQQIREMVSSGLVEVASHSHNLHRGVLANPQGNTQPAAISRVYDENSGRYEDNASYRKRIYADLARSVALIKKETGKKPRVLVWPYGAYNQVTIDIARELGMPVTVSLDSGKNTINKLDNVRRLLIGNRSDLEDFVWLISNDIKPAFEPVRVVHVDLDYVYDPDPLQQEKNLGRLLDRVKNMGVNTVYLQAFADPDGDGNADRLYFPNRHLPMRADLFNRVAWQLRTRTGVEVYGWLPVLAYDLPKSHTLANSRVLASTQHGANETGYHRLSPFNDDALKFVGDIYEDLAKHSYIAGLVFHDDAYLSDYEDASPWAMNVYRREWGLANSIEAIRNDPVQFKKWTHLKTQELTRWTHELTKRAGIYRSPIKTARNIYAGVVMNPESEAWFAQSLEVSLKHYDYTAIMAMPYMEGAKDPEAWLRQLVAKVAAVSGALKKTVFELQSVDWRNQTALDSAELASQMKLLLHNGAANFGYYPDDFIRGLPKLDEIRPAISLAIAVEGE